MSRSPTSGTVWRVVAVLFAALVIDAGPMTQAFASPERWAREGWTTDFSRTTIDLREVFSGGVPRDGIPSIDAPKFVSVDGHEDLAGREPVISLEIDGDARAYPLRILTWHEIVNDTVGGVPVAVTYCPLCNAAIVFDRRIEDKTLEFGTTGKLRNSDLIMYDRQSQSWWQQFSGEAVAGVFSGQRLKMLPARLESFALFKSRHPQARVLVPNNPGMRRYGVNPYVSYDSSARPFLYDGTLPEDIPPMARVVVVDTEDQPTAVALTHLKAEETLELGDLVLTWLPDQASALDTMRIAEGRDVGNVVVQHRASDGALTDALYDVTFAFVFHAFHPEGRWIKE